MLWSKYKLNKGQNGFRKIDYSLDGFVIDFLLETCFWRCKVNLVIQIMLGKEEDENCVPSF